MIPDRAPGERAPVPAGAAAEGGPLELAPLLTGCPSPDAVTGVHVGRRA